MGLNYLIAGFVFFFLPNLSIIDILPDFIGCICIIKGLEKLSDLTPGLADAKKSFFKVLYIHLIKFLLMFTVPFFGNSDGGYILIFSFTFLVLDLIYTLPSFKRLLDGFVYLGDRTNSSVLFENQSEFSTLTSVFLISKSVLAMIPDLSYVSNPDSSNVVTLSGAFYISTYKTLLVGVNFLVTGIIGIVWLYYAFRYFSNIRKDKELMGALTNQYKTEILPNKGLFIRRNVKNAFVFLAVGGLLTFDLIIDCVNVIPDVLEALFYVFAALILKKYTDSRKFIYSSIVLFGVSVASWVLLAKYAIDFPEVSILINMEAYSYYIFVIVANILKYTVQIFVFWTLFKILDSLINEHTGSPVNELESISNFRSDQQNLLKRNNMVVWSLGIICSVSGVARISLLFHLPSYGVFDFIINLVYVINLVKLLSESYEAVEYKYL